MTADEIQERATTSLQGTFPYTDCRSVQQHSSHPESFIADLDHFLAGIAGFAQSPLTIPTRSPEQIAQGVNLLQQGFFARYSQHAAIASHLTPSNTPHLYAELNAAEALRPHILRMLIEAQAAQGTKGTTA